MAADNINENPEITVTTVARDKRGRFVSVKKPDQVKPQVNLEASLKEILKFLVDNQKSTLNLYNSQSEKIDKTNDHLGNIENELSNLEKYFGQLTSFFSKKDEEDQKDAIENSFQKINNQHLKNILIVEQKQLKELEMLNEQFIDFFEMNEKNIQDQKEQKIEREREAAAPPPTIEQPKQEAAKDIKKNEGMFSGFGSIVKNTFGGLLGIGKGIFKGLGTIFSTLFSIVSVPFKFISSALGSILSFIPGFGIISKFMPSFSMGIGGLLSTLGIGALGYVGFKYLTDDKYKAGVDKYMGGITKFFSPFINAIKGFFDTPIGQAISSFVGNLWEKNIKPGLEGIKQGIVDTLKTFIGEDNWGQLKNSFLTITDWISSKLPKSYKELSDSVKYMTNSIVDGLNVIIAFVQGIAPLLGINPENFKLLNKPFSDQVLKGTPYNTEGTFSGSAQQMKELMETSRRYEGGGKSEKNKLGSGAAGYHQFMPKTFEHVIETLQNEQFLSDINKTAKEIGIKELSKDDISKISSEFKSSSDKSEYIAKLPKDIQDLFFIAFSKNTLGTMQRMLGREVSPFEMKFAGFGTGNIVPIIKSAESGENDSTYNVLKRVYAQNAPGGKDLTENDLATLSINGDSKAFYELARKSKFGDFEKLVSQNPNLFYKKEDKDYNKNVLLTPSETINQYKKLLGTKITTSPEKSVDQNDQNDQYADIRSYGSIAGKLGILGAGLKYGGGGLLVKGGFPAMFTAAVGSLMWLNKDLQDIFYRKTKNSGVYGASGEMAYVPLSDEEIKLYQGKSPTTFHWSGALAEPINEESKADEIKRIGKAHADYVFGTRRSSNPPPNNLLVGGSPTTTNTTIINNNYNTISDQQKLKDLTR